MAQGSIRKRGKTWTIIVYLGTDLKGKPRYKWVGGFKTKPEARKALNKAQAEVDAGTYIEETKISVAEYLLDWFDNYEINLTPSTARGYKTNIKNHIIPEIGHMKLVNLSPIVIQKLYNRKIKAGISTTTVLYMHRVLHKALKQAVGLQLIRFNPTENLELPRKRKYEAQVLTEEQVKKMLQIAKGTDAYIPLLLAVGLGLRRGEVLGLMWKDIDFDRKIVSVNRNVVYEGREFKIGDLKTRSSRRSILISDGIANALKEHKKVDNGFVINNDASPLCPATLDKRYKSTLKKAGLPNIRFHDLRHTNATLMLKGGVHAKVASQRLGHSTIGITMDLYSHVMSDMQEEAAKILDIL